MKKRRGVKFTNRKHPYAAIMAVILGAISLISLGIVVYRSYAAGGVAKQGFGFTGLFALLFAVTGVVLSALTINDKRAFRLFPVLGLVLNGLVFVFLGLIMYAGSHF
ncbi:MAG: DUF6142 family protein [Acetatifactor sp.]|nr:DUF6142 family protein [Acetatifactor sp.]